MSADRAPGGPGARRTDPPDLESIRRLTRRLARRRRRLARSVADDLTDLYTLVLGTVIVVSIMVHGLGTTGPAGFLASAGPAPLVAGGAVAEPVWLPVGAVIALVAACLGPLRRLGPLFLRPEQVQWWLPLPGDRSSLLRHLVRRELAVAWAASVGTGALIALIDGGGVLGAAGWTVLAGGATGLALVALLASQLRGGPTVVVGERLVAFLGVGACAGASLLVPLPDALVAPAPALSGALLALAAGAWWWRGPRRRLAGLADHSLRQASAQAFGVQAAALAMDTRALGRMVSAPPRRPVRPAGLRPARVCVRLPGAPRALLGVGAVDWLLLVRQPRRFAQAAAGALLACSAIAAGLPGPVTALLLAAGGWVAVLAVAEPARRAHADPGPDNLWTARPVWVRAGHLLAPSAVMLVWSLAVWGALVLRSGLGPGGAAGAPALMVASGIGWGAVALRSGFRRDPDFSMLIPTPLGAVPLGAGEVVLSGPDAALLVCLPAAAAVAGFPVTGSLVTGQTVASGLALAWALRTGRER